MSIQVSEDTTIPLPDWVNELLTSWGIKLRKIQEEAILKGLLDGESILVSSPSGSGKTLIGELALLSSARLGKKALYLVPLRALAAEKFHALSEKFKPLGYVVAVSSGDFDHDPNMLAAADIIVTTYEKFDSILRSKVSWILDIQTVVIDEIQMMGDPIRGPRIEGAIMRFRRIMPDAQLVGLTATIANPVELADWMGCNLVESNERPVPLKPFVSLVDNKREAVLKITMSTIHSGGQVMVFLGTRRSVESEGTELAEYVGKHLSKKEKEAIRNRLQQIKSQGVRISSKLESLLLNGVGIHHAGLSWSSRKIVEDLFRESLIFVICCTTSLSAGINTPARTVILRDVRMFSADESNEVETIYMDANTVHQILGRAGRPGYDEVGYGIILAGNPDEQNEILQRYFKSYENELIPLYEPIRSSFGNYSSLLEQTLVTIHELNDPTIEQIEEFINQSFWSYQHRNDLSTKSIRLGRIDALTAIEMIASPEDIHEAENIVDYVQLRRVTDRTIDCLIDYGNSSYTCSFSDISGPKCSCSSFRSGRKRLCKHLIALGMKIHIESPGHADGIIPLALGKFSVIDTLMRSKLIIKNENRYMTTEIGRRIVQLYLKIETAQNIRASLFSIENIPDIIHVLEMAISTESLRELPEEFTNALTKVIIERKSLWDITYDSEASTGDFLTLFSSARWLTHCIAQIASSEGYVDIGRAASEIETILSPFRDVAEFSITEEVSDDA